MSEQTTSTAMASATPSNPAPTARAARRGRAFREVPTYVVVGAFLLIALLPVVIIVLTAFKDSTELTKGVFNLPKEWRWSNFAAAWTEGHFQQYFISSVVVAASVVGLATLLSILAGYAFGRMHFPLQGAIFVLFLLGIMVPQEAFIIPLYHNMRRLGLYDTYWALILPQVGMSVCFGASGSRGVCHAAPRSRRRRQGRRLQLVDCAVAGAAACGAAWPCSRSWCCSSCGPGTTSCWPWCW